MLSIGRSPCLINGHFLTSLDFDNISSHNDFADQNQAGIYVGEFSFTQAANDGPSPFNYLRDAVSLFEEFKWRWTYHAFREANVWNLEQNGPDGLKSLALLQSYFRRNA